jgi:hypothetical protein
MNVQVVDEFVYELRLKESNVEKRRKINSLALCYIQTSFYHADTSDCLVYFFSFPHPEAHVRYNLASLLCTIQSGSSFESRLYDINLRATHTTILSIRGVTILIYLVSITTDSIRPRVVLFKTVTIPTSDLKSEFLCQSSLSCAEPTDPLNTSYAWEISHTLVTTYHPYCHSPSALTEYLKQKLRLQRAKRLGRSLPAQVEQHVPLEHNTLHEDEWMRVRLFCNLLQVSSVI